MNYGASTTSAHERQHLLLRAQTGDPEALNVLFESCRRNLYCRALQILARPQDAEDAVQEAMLAAFTRLHQFQGRADFLTWATRIVINAALQHIRRTRTKPTVAWDQVDRGCDGALFSESLKDPQPSPEEHLQRVEHREMLQGALSNLPFESRRAIQLCKFADCSLKEAANSLGLPVSTVKVRLHRGKRALTVHVKKELQVRHKPAGSKPSFQLCPDSKEGLSTA
ncbi:MAG TPA: sigma-70 family RNA polymerase sigma factor [Candidatus Eremiobacteraceae bacterium]|nr:sigma-70 family RNA polymerase sigma factor [Candidatus Eremiobacteraceae bacterium]